ncbi:MAG: hypothetical protein LAO31_02390 [Acidobacteriia bacterium]|nr:hypothetical protein [Terriglobia bacterium]
MDGVRGENQGVYFARDSAHSIGGGNMWAFGLAHEDAHIAHRGIGTIEVELGVRNHPAVDGADRVRPSGQAA